MNKEQDMSYIDLMKNVDMGSVIDEKKIFNVEKRMNIEFPIGYKEFIKTYNGAEGEIGENSYIVIWKIEEIAELNNEYGVSEFTPGLVYFGSDGGGMAYAFDMRNEKKTK